MTAWGRPDLGRPIRDDRHRLFPLYERPGHYGTLPTRLEIAGSPEEGPRFRLTYVRGENPSLPPDPYAVLDLRIRSAPPDAKAVAAARDRHPEATVTPIAPAGGWLRIDLLEADETESEDLGRPLPLQWNELAWTRLSIRMSTTAADLIHRAISEGLVVLSAEAHLQVAGVAPRIPARVRLDPFALLRRLRSEDGELPPLDPTELVRLLASPDGRDAIAVEELDDDVMDEAVPAGDDPALAETVARHLVGRLGRWVAPDGEDADPRVRFDVPRDADSAELTLDLSEPRSVLETFRLPFDPVAQARELLDQRPADDLVRTVTVPALETGHVPVEVTANLPQRRVGILQIGTTLEAPARPPARVHSISHTVRFEGPDDAETVVLRFAPDEPLAYTATPFLVVRSARGSVRRLDGEGRECTGRRIHLQPGDFPARIIPVEAAPELLRLARVHGEHRARTGSDAPVERFELTPEEPTVALTEPRDGEPGEIVLEAVSREDDARLTYGPVSSESVRLGLHSFPEYGPHRIEVTCSPPDGEIVGVELLPEGATPGPDTITVLSFDAETTTRTWGWLAASPFRPGYRYRLHAPGLEPDEGWSEARSPFEALEVPAPERSDAPASGTAETEA